MVHTFYIILHLYTAPRNIMMASQQEFYSFREVLWCQFMPNVTCPTDVVPPCIAVKR